MPLLPAMATMKEPFCGPLIATAASAPKMLPATMLLASSRAESYVQVNSALVYPSTGTLLNVTVTKADSPAFRLVGVALVVTVGSRETICNCVSFKK